MAEIVIYTASDGKIQIAVNLPMIQYGFLNNKWQIYLVLSVKLLPSI